MSHGMEGKVNNPKGRTPGSKNKIPSPAKTIIDSFLDDEKEGFKNIYKNLDKELQAKIYVELLKIRTPKPLNEDEQQDNINRDKLMEKLFGDAL
ncbi:MAG: hypothetical protein LBS07_05815 [Prevotellaceae bacterium]|jgi:hypothetical protein|nr:hypothetical protein [Prevotellaceae bacterium]